MTRSSLFPTINCTNSTRVSFSSLEEWIDVGLRQYEFFPTSYPTLGLDPRIVLYLAYAAFINNRQSPLFVPLTSTMIHYPWILYFKASMNHNRMQLPPCLVSYKSWLPREAVRPEPLHHGLLTSSNTTDSNHGTSFVSHSLSRVPVR